MTRHTKIYWAGFVVVMAVLIVAPLGDRGKLPAVICLHGTGGTKESQMGFMKELAKRGIIGVAIDARNQLQVDLGL